MTMRIEAAGDDIGFDNYNDDRNYENNIRTSATWEWMPTTAGCY